MSDSLNRTRPGKSGRFRFAVLGYPIQHSLSPSIWRLFAEQQGLDLDYQAIPVQAPDLAVTLAELAKQGYQGVNLTAPLKQAALALVQASSQTAGLAGSINMITFCRDGSYYGDNSDGAGFIRDLVEHKNYSIQDKTILILGAGGAVRGLLPALIQENPKQIYIANRTLAKAQLLASDFPPTIPLNWQNIDQNSYDLLIQCASSSHYGQTLILPKGILNPQACCYDLVYGPNAQAFLTWAKAQAASYCYDGLGMLVEQAALAFQTWCQLPVNTNDVIQQLTIARISV